MALDPKQLSELRLHQLDELLVQQHVVRRFRLNHEQEFNALRSLRRDLDDCLFELCPDIPDQRLLAWQLRTSQTAQCINHFDTKANLRLVATGEKDAAYQNFLEDLDAGGSSFEFSPSITRVLVEDEDACSALFEILRKHAKPVLDIAERLNFFDYYTPFAMTSYVAGAKMYKNYLRAKVGIDKLRFPFDGPSASFTEMNWLFTPEAATDDELSSLALTYCYRPTRPSRNIRIFGGDQNVFTVDGQTIENCLILCVPTDQIPDRIDESLRYFRDALTQELSDHFFIAAQPDASSFQASRFMTQFSRTSLLLNDWDQVQRNMVGLWVWDKVNLEGAKTIDIHAQVQEEIEVLMQGFEHGLTPYTESTIKSYSEATSAMIGASKLKGKRSLRKLDRFVTGGEIMLGERA